MKGEAMMKKRHLEILGYHVLQVSRKMMHNSDDKSVVLLIMHISTQIPHFEWNSMELSTEEAWKEYLRKKIFSELP